MHINNEEMMVNENTPQHYDLKQAISYMDEKKDKKYIGLIKKLLSAHSAYTDLMTAMVNLGTAKATLGPSSILMPGVSNERIISSLGTEALILYCRATQTETKHRNDVPVKQRYDSATKALHDTLMSYRNDAVAHFGNAMDKPFGFLRKETITATYHNGNVNLTHPYISANYRGDMLSALETVIPTALDILDKIKLEYENEFKQALSDLPEDSTVVSAIKKSTFNPNEFYHNLPNSVVNFVDVSTKGGKNAPNTYNTLAKAHI